MMEIRFRSEEGTPLCACGCGVTASKLGGFKQGHDARLKGMLQKAHLAGEEVSLFDDHDGLVYSLSARDWAVLRGWAQYIDRHAAVVSNKAERAARRETTKNANRATAKNGSLIPWEDVLKMKEAIKRVNAEGYKGMIQVTKDNFDRILAAKDLQTIFEELA